MVSGGVRASAREGQAQASRNQGLTDFLFWAHTVEEAQKLQVKLDLGRAVGNRLAGMALGLGDLGLGSCGPG